MQYQDYSKEIDNALSDGGITSVEQDELLKKAIITKTNNTLDNGLEHRIGAELHDWEYNDTIDKDDLVTNIRHCIDSLYTTCNANQKADCNIKRVGGFMRDFKRDLNANAYYGLSYNAYVLKYPLKNVWFFTEHFVHRLNRASHSIYCKPDMTIDVQDSGISSKNVNGVNVITANKDLDTKKIGTMKAHTKHRKYFSAEDYNSGIGPYVTRKRTRIKTTRGKPGYDENGIMRTDITDKSIIRFTIDDTPSRPDVFKHRLLMFIDGRLFTDLVLYTDGQSVTLVLDPDRTGLTMAQVMEYCDENKDYKWSLIGIPFTTTKRGHVINPFAIKTDNITNTKYVEGLYPGKIPASSSRIVTDNIWLYAAATNTVDTVDSEEHAYEDNLSIMDFGFAFNIQYDSSSTMFKTSFGEEASKFLASRSQCSVEMINIPNVIAFLNIGTMRIFQYGCTDERPNPIPPENMILFKRDSNDNLRLVHNYKITQYFPNVYKVENTDVKYYDINRGEMMTYTSSEISNIDNLYVLVFYGKNDKTKFVNPIKPYMTYNQNYANDIIAGEVPDAIKAYIPMTNEYSEVNYLEYHSLATRQIEHEYKLETLRELVQDDYSRLIDIYERHQDKLNKKMHACPRYHYTYEDIVSDDEEINESQIGDIYVQHIKRGSWHKEVSFDLSNADDIVTGKDTKSYLQFSIQHPDERSFDASVWLDGVHIENVTCSTKNFQTTIIVDILGMDFKPGSQIIIEMLKVCTKQSTTLELTMPPKHNSMKLPRNVYDAVSPQNMMICVKKQIPGPNGDPIDVWQVASNYEMYWLLIGNTQYIDGVPVNHSKNPYASSIRTDVVLENNGIALLQNDNVAVIANKETRFEGDYNMLVERGNEHYIYMTDKDDFDRVTKDIVLMQNLGYYGLDRRRFFYYMPYGKNDPDIFITPITDFFADEQIMIKNTDIHFTKKFVIKNSGSGDDLTSFIYPNFSMDPNPEKYRIFMDGKLIDYYYDYTIQDIGTGVDLNDPSASSLNLENGWNLGSNVKYKITKPFNTKVPHSILFEYLPYKYRLVYRGFETDGIITFKDDINRPYNYKFFDVYLDGRLLMEDEIQVISERVILIKSMTLESTMVYHTISIYEKAHDEDVINYVWRPGVGHVHDKSIFETNMMRADHSVCKTVDARYKKPNNLSIIDHLLMTDADFKKFMIPSWDVARTKAESDYFLGVGGIDARILYEKQMREEIEKENANHNS